MEGHRLDLERELERCEKIHKQSPDSTSWSQLKAAKAKLNLDYTREIKKIFFTKQKYHEYSNRPSRLLAYQFKKEQSERTIMAIRTAEDEVTYDPKNINFMIFTANYSGAKKYLVSHQLCKVSHLKR